MDQIKFSDPEPTMVAKRTFDKLLEQIQSSNLNFHLTISPFSASIFLKKSLKKSVKTASLENESFKKDLQAKNKLIKEKDKEIYKLEQKFENLDTNLMRTKSELKDIKSENVRLSKKLKIV